MFLLMKCGRIWNEIRLYEKPADHHILNLKALIVMKILKDDNDTITWQGKHLNRCKAIDLFNAVGRGMEIVIGV